MTERLYDNGELTEFDAKVISCDSTAKGCEVVLDRSAFFPEGGGQAGDSGHLDKVRVTDTYERNGEVIHLCIEALEVGQNVHGCIDADIRRRRMQNHSGEHLLMGFIHSKYGFDNVGFHLGQSDVTIDLNGVLTPEQLRECEQLANEAIARNVPFTISYPDSNELTAMEYRSKLDMTENVRIVTIEGIDKCACCAPHVSTAGQIGIVKVISQENYKGGIRVHILCGLDALDIIRQRMDSVSEISRLLSAKPELTADAVNKLLTENTSLKKQLSDMDKLRAAEMISSLKNDSRESFCIFADGISNINLREIANKAVTMTDGMAGVFSKKDNGYSYIIASEKLPLRTLVKDINKALDGRGGGSDSMVQGTVLADREVIEKYFKEHN